MLIWFLIILSYSVVMNLYGSEFLNVWHSYFCAENNPSTSAWRWPISLTVSLSKIIFSSNYLFSIYFCYWFMNCWQVLSFTVMSFDVSFNATYCSSSEDPLSRNLIVTLTIVVFHTVFGIRFSETFLSKTLR